MTIVFFSNFMNVHQLPFCEELIKHIGADNFKFVATSRMASDRVQMGFEDMNVTRPFVIRAYEDEFSAKEAMRLAVESDVAIIGSSPVVYLKERMKNDKLTFRYTERLLKRGDWLMLHPSFIRSTYNYFLRYRKKNLYVLCASAYAKRDLMKCGFPGNKCYKWGYFPEMKYSSSFEEVFMKRDKLGNSGLSLLWVGRLIGWKHPEIAIDVAKQLKDDRVSFSMSIIGDGPLKKDLLKQIDSFKLEKEVKMLGAKSHEFVLDMMDKNDIFLFTSDKNEGWGAVLNEAMNSGCVVLADKSIGSVPFLINDGINGLTYSSKEEIATKVKMLDAGLLDMLKLREMAWNTINGEWNIVPATNNLIYLINCLLQGKKIDIEKGPCSYA